MRGHFLIEHQDRGVLVTAHLIELLNWKYWKQCHHRDIFLFLFCFYFSGGWALPMPVTTTQEWQESLCMRSCCSNGQVSKETPRWGACNVKVNDQINTQEILPKIWIQMNFNDLDKLSGSKRWVFRDFLGSHRSGTWKLDIYPLCSAGPNIRNVPLWRSVSLFL